jgi:hypothetical protein
LLLLLALASATHRPVQLSFTIWTFDVEQVRGYIDAWRRPRRSRSKDTVDVDWGQSRHDDGAVHRGHEPRLDVCVGHWLQNGRWLARAAQPGLPEEELEALTADMFPFTLRE